MEFSTLNLSKWWNYRIRIPSKEIITFNIFASCEHHLLLFSFIREVFNSFFLLK